MPHTRILYVEDSSLLRLMVKELLEAEGWLVDACADGVEALSKLEDAGHYDLLIFDNELPCVSGIELTRRARSLPHRRDTPIVVMSASNVAAETRRAGADSFIRKPDDVHGLIETIALLLATFGNR